MGQVIEHQAKENILDTPPFNGTAGGVDAPGHIVEPGLGVLRPVVSAAVDVLQILALFSLKLEGGDGKREETENISLPICTRLPGSRSSWLGHTMTREQHSLVQELHNQRRTERTEILRSSVAAQF